jgi:hypothetical protein
MHLRHFSVATFCAVMAMGPVVRSQPADSQKLPDADGPRVEYVGRPPHEFEIVDIFVYALPEQAGSHVARPNRFASGTARLTLDIRVKDLPRLGTSFRYEVLTNEGVLEMTDGLFSFARLRGEGVSSLDFDLRPKSGPFKDGPYQLQLYMNEIRVAVLNWTVGG